VADELRNAVVDKDGQAVVDLDAAADFDPLVEGECDRVMAELADARPDDDTQPDADTDVVIDGVRLAIQLPEIETVSVVVAEPFRDSLVNGVEDTLFEGDGLLKGLRDVDTDEELVGFSVCSGVTVRALTCCVRECVRDETGLGEAHPLGDALVLLHAEALVLGLGDFDAKPEALALEEATFE
jgi:hypothetical protein